VSTRREASIEELEERDNADDPSLLRFLVDMRGEDLSSMTLRDDLMTMLIAGHETTAAMREFDQQFQSEVLFPSTPPHPLTLLSFIFVA
jgi:hypothetical protein